MLKDSFLSFLPILILLIAVVVVISRLPKVELGHSTLFRKRRVMNWLPLGLTYAMLYMGRYNLTVSKNALGNLMSNADFGTIFFWGTIVYGFSFVINGPLTDKFGGRRTMLIGAIGAAICNILMGIAVYSGVTTHLVLIFSVLYAANMYFQSFGAVAIVKVNAAWFHLRERGTFGGIFGILISLGLYFAFDWNQALLNIGLPVFSVFLVPAGLLLSFALIDYFLVRDNPSQAGHLDFDTADATNEPHGQALPVLEVAKRMFTNPIILTIGAIEFCSGFLRNAIMHWYIIMAKQTGIMETFVPKNWGLLLCVAGITGGVIAGTISDHIFHSRRGPVAAVLYGGMLLGAIILFFLLSSPMLGTLVVLMSMCIIGVHGMLSGTASMDFGGKRNVGVAVGMIDGLVYLGTAAQSILYGSILPQGDAAKNPENWARWPIAMIPIALVGLILGTRLWHAKPGSKPAVH